ncbi:MAG: polyprenyl synthetase [Phycisphaerae bacterium]|nr:polyprenyl synthetase [Phycisphaerae bacterium]
MSLINKIRVDDELAGILGEELDRVGGILEDQLRSEHGIVNDLCLHIESYRGKMLRPSLVILSALTSGSKSITHAHRVVAAVVEMIHMATLIHDDVLDEADTRRGGRTINNLHGNEMAVMLGDYLISNSFHLCSSIEQPWINSILGSITNTLCEGELIQLGNRQNLDIDQQTYFTIVEKKTASLIGASCRIGAMLSDPEGRSADHLERFGVSCGIAFQITDDLLDLVGDQDVVGKSVGRDLEKGKLTLPTIYAMNEMEGDDRRRLVDLIEKRDLVGLRSVVRDAGLIDRAMDKASGLVESAKNELESLDETPARILLGSLADGIIDRRY